MATRTINIQAAANISKVPRSLLWSFMAALNQGNTFQDEIIVDHALLVTLLAELITDHATFKTAVDEMNTLTDELRADHATFKAWGDALKTRCVTPPTFVIDTNFDVKNSVAFEIEVAGIQMTVAANVNFDTGTSTIVTTNAYWAAGLLSIDIDGTTAYVDWGAENVAEAGAITNLAAVTASGGVVCGYVTVQAAAGQDFVGGTDALTTGTGGQVAQATNYYNDQYVGDAVLTPPATITAPEATAGPATLSAPNIATLTATAQDDFATRELGTPS